MPILKDGITKYITNRKSLLIPRGGINNSPLFQGSPSLSLKSIIRMQKAAQSFVKTIEARTTPTRIF